MYRKRMALAMMCSVAFPSHAARSTWMYLSPAGLMANFIAELYRQRHPRADQDDISTITTADGEIFQLSPDEDPIIGFPDEVADIIDYLRDPDQFLQFGAAMPKGVLFVGPPGTGKTSMARAIAREANAEFVAAVGSEFVNMYVGVGAANVRKLFQRARDLLKKGKKVIIFIDEIDALGSRAETDGGGTIEYNQTLNQLLTEMDGFKNTENLLVIAATNREDVLDSALLRPGRFDRRAYFKLPEAEDRLKILQQYCKNRPIDTAIDFGGLAERTYGMSGADLKNIINEAAIEAAREKGNSLIAERHFEIALTKAEQRRDVYNRSRFRR